MRRDSWRSVPMMCRPPSSTTRSCSGAVTLRASASADSRAAAGARAGSSPFRDRSSLARKSGLPPSRMSVPRPAMLVAMVTVPARPAWATISASRSWYLALSTWCGIPRFLRSFERCSEISIDTVPTSTGWPLLVARRYLGGHRVELLAGRLVHDVRVVRPAEPPVGRDHRHVELVDLGELLGLGGRRPRHAGQLLIHPEIVLEGDGGEGLVLGLDPHPLLGLDRLVEAVRPPPPGHQAPGELVHDDDLAVLDDVVDVLLEQGVGLEGLLDVVERIHVGGVVQVVDPEEALRVGHALLGQGDRARLLVHDVVAGRGRLDLGELALHDGGGPGQLGNDAVDLVVLLGRALGRARDDQGGARLVDQDGVDLVDDGVVVLALDHLLETEAHVVPEVVEAELVVGAVDDVGAIGVVAGARPERGEPDVRRGMGRVVAVRHLVLDDADLEAQRVVDRPHPLGIAPGQVVVHGDDVRARAGQRVQIGGEGCHQGLALAGGHLGDLPLVQHHPAHELDVEVPQAHRAARGLPHRREGLGQEVVELGAVGKPLAQFVRLGGEFGVGQGLHRGLERVDLLDRRPHALDVPLVLRAEDGSNDG